MCGFGPDRVWSWVVWGGMRWYALVWVGLGWSGLVCVGMRWYGLVWVGMGWSGLGVGLGWYGFLWEGAALCDAACGPFGVRVVTTAHTHTHTPHPHCPRGVHSQDPYSYEAAVGHYNLGTGFGKQTLAGQRTAASMTFMGPDRDRFRTAEEDARLLAARERRKQENEEFARTQAERSAKEAAAVAELIATAAGGKRSAAV